MSKKNFVGLGDLVKSLFVILSDHVKIEICRSESPCQKESCRSD